MVSASRATRELQDLASIVAFGVDDAPNSNVLRFDGVEDQILLEIADSPHAQIPMWIAVDFSRRANHRHAGQIENVWKAFDWNCSAVGTPKVSLRLRYMSSRSCRA